MCGSQSPPAGALRIVAVRCFDAARGPNTNDDDAGYAAVLRGEIERIAAAELMLLGLRWVLANRDVLQRLPAADQQTRGNSPMGYDDTDSVVALCVFAKRPRVYHLLQN